MPTFKDPAAYLEQAGLDLENLFPVRDGNSGYKAHYASLARYAKIDKWEIDEERFLEAPELREEFKEFPKGPCGVPDYMRYPGSEATLEVYLWCELFLPLSRVLESIFDEDISLQKQLPVSGAPIDEDSSRDKCSYFPDLTLYKGDYRRPNCGQRLLVCDVKFCRNSKPSDLVDNAGPMTLSFFGQILYYLITCDLCFGMVITEDFVIVVYAIGPPQNDQTSTVLSDAMSDVDPSTPRLEGKRPRTAETVSPSVPRPKRLAVDQSPDQLAALPDVSAQRLAVRARIQRPAPPLLSSDELAQPSSSPAPKTPERQTQGYASSDSFRPPSSDARRLEDFGADYTICFNLIPKEKSKMWPAMIFGFFCHVIHAFEKGHGVMSPNKIDIFAN